jgi:hypothetical protein
MFAAYAPAPGNSIAVIIAQFRSPENYATRRDGQFT